MLKSNSIDMRFFGLSESSLNRSLAVILNPKVSYLTKVDRYELVVEISGTKQRLNAIKSLIVSRLGRYFIGYGRNNSLEKTVGDQLIKRHLTITSAESLTAGMFQSTIGNVPGISAVFPGGFVTYSNHAKHQLLGIPNHVIDTYGVVSKPVAKWMAEQSRKLMETDLAVSFTGAAGPSSLEGHPAGTVWIGLAVRNQKPKARLYHLEPLYRSLNGFKTAPVVNREMRDGVRLLSVKTGLKMVNDELNRLS